jgi:hypothetical protein
MRMKRASHPTISLLLQLPVWSFGENSNADKPLAVLAQVSYVYVYAYYWKTDENWVLNHTATELALRLEYFTEVCIAHRALLMVSLIGHAARISPTTAPS